MDIFNRTGKMALGSRLRLLTATVTNDAAKIYALYDIDFNPKWFPVFFILSEKGEMTITEIANDIGHSQPSVTQIVREMSTAELLKNKQKSNDKRKNVVALTPKGKKISEKLRIQCSDVDAAIDGLIEESKINLWDAIEEWEFLLNQKSLLRRVQEQKKLRESGKVEIVEYTDQYKDAFKSLNEEWISKYFQMEEADYKAVDNPQEYIIDKGGEIFIALYRDKPVGVCALIPMHDSEYEFELAKMAVTPNAQGKSIGWLLGKAAVDAAARLGATKIYLESNTKLTPAINLYSKLGFVKTTKHSTPYKRCNIQMELLIKK